MANLDTGYAYDGTAKTYTTSMSAFTAASNNDNIRFYYADGNKNRMWQGQSLSHALTTKFVNAEGMLDDRQVTFCPIGTGIHWYYLGGDLSAGTTQLVLKNLTLLGWYADVRWNNTGGAGTGGGFKLENVLSIGSVYHAYLQGGEDDFDFLNCCFVGGDRFPQVTTNAQDFTATNCTIIGMDHVRAYNAVGTFINCVFDACDFATLTNSVFTNCVFTVADPGAGTRTDCHYSKTFEDLAYWGDEMVDAGGAQAEDYRVTTDSFLCGEGTNTGAPATDCDGNSRANPPTVGWHEGTSNPFEYPAAAAGGGRRTRARMHNV